MRKRKNFTAVAQEVRQRIYANQWPPGTRLPPKLDLCKLFGASNMTVQRALTLLWSQGFTESHGRNGTFVTPQPPCRYRVGLVFATMAAGNLYAQAALRAARLMARDVGDRFVLYDQCSCWHPGGATADMRRLETAVAERQLSGVIFFGGQAPYAGAAIVRGNTVPHLFAGMYRAVAEVGGTAITYEDPMPAIWRYMRQRGRRRLAVLAIDVAMDRQQKRLWRAAARHGVEMRNEWTHFGDAAKPYISRSVLHLLAALPRRDRPDTLYIADDHLVAEAAAALAASRFAVPRDLLVLAHANFPLPVTTALPVVHAGFDAVKTLAACLAALEAIIAGKKPAPAVIPFEIGRV